MLLLPLPGTTETFWLPYNYYKTLLLLPLPKVTIHHCSKILHHSCLLKPLPWNPSVAITIARHWDLLIAIKLLQNLAIVAIAIRSCYCQYHCQRSQSIITIRYCITLAHWSHCQALLRPSDCHRTTTKPCYCCHCHKVLLLSVIVLRYCITLPSDCHRTTTKPCYCCHCHKVLLLSVIALRYCITLAHWSHCHETLVLLLPLPGTETFWLPSNYYKTLLLLPLP